jgi:DNA mismatch endonuclease (patch repair protein)
MERIRNKMFKRDKRSPIPSSTKVSRIMSSIKQKNTKPELIVRQALFAAGIRGYRIHWTKAEGKPDIAFPSRKTAIFIHGCFWHRCPHCNLSLPKSNILYWEQKFKANVARDNSKIVMLQENGWQTLVLWECQIYKSPTRMVKKILFVLGKHAR